MIRRPCQYIRCQFVSALCMGNTSDCGNDDAEGDVFCFLSGSYGVFLQIAFYYDSRALLARHLLRK